jgi:acetylornithine deacetylase
MFGLSIKHFDATKPTLLNSHHDTVNPNQVPMIRHWKEGKLFGLGSNDAGGCLVSLLATFVHFIHWKFTLQYSNGSLSRRGKQWKNGLNSVLKHLPELGCAIVGNPL